MSDDMTSTSETTKEINAINMESAINQIKNRPESARQLVRSCLDRIAAREPIVRAWAWHDEDHVLKALEEQLEHGKPGKLVGVPVGIKDIIDTADMPTQYGSKAYEGNQPSRDAAIVRKLKQAGAIMMGKTVTTEFAYTHAGPTTNPHHPLHSPGGSSSGSAAAVADGMVPVAIGTQTGGSVLRPSSYCGIVGFKPTYGLLEMDGVMPFSSTLDTLGIHACHIDDIETVFQALTDMPDDKIMDIANTLTGKKIIRLAWFPGYDAPMASDDANAVLLEARETWTKQSGFPSPHSHVSIEPINLSEELFAKLGQANHTIMMFEGSKIHQKEYHANRELLGPATIDMIEEGMQISESSYQDALTLAHACRKEYSQKMQHVDALLTFSAPGEAPLLEQGTGSGVFNRLWTTIGAPAITLPVGKGRNQLPIGVQLVGHQHQDWVLLALAKRMSQI